ncbi:hypothetical protein Q7P37_001787 [Cladosporium fusiforme]
MTGPQNNAALLGALMAFGGASKSNGEMVRSRANSPGTSAANPRGPQYRSVSKSPTPYQRSTTPAARMLPAVPLRQATTGEATSNRARVNAQRPTPPPLKPKPRRLSVQHSNSAAPHLISPSTSYVGIIENNTLRPTKPSQHPDALRKPHGSMEVRGQAKAAPHQREDQEERQKDRTHRQEKEFQSPPRAGATIKTQTAQDRTSAEAISSDDEEYVSASEDTASSPNRAIQQKPDILAKRPPTPPPTRSRAPRPLHSPQPQLHSTSKPINIGRAHSNSDASVRSTSAHSNPSLNATYHQLYQQRRTPLTLGDDLANAMVASSLATSRASSPHRLAPPSNSAPRRQSHLLPFHSRTPSPTKKGMRHTLREPDSSSESETGQHPYGKHKKKRHLRPKHPNKHHEGDRKRWRDAVTEGERKRYEGLWAANRGMHLSPSLPNNIHNIVVRDIWMRSRLPRAELEMVWNLVVPQTSPSARSLGKEEFVVGLWLIDQRLKGRKLPVKVSETVWASVKGLQGIKLKTFKG